MYTEPTDGAGFIQPAVSINTPASQNKYSFVILVGTSRSAVHNRQDCRFLKRAYFREQPLIFASTYTQQVEPARSLARVWYNRYHQQCIYGNQGARFITALTGYSSSCISQIRNREGKRKRKKPLLS